MNKHLLFFAVITITALLSSCSKEIEPTPEVQTKSTLEYKDVALLLTSANIDIDICNEVSKAAKQSIEKQRDENYLFSEILKPEEVKTKVSDIQNSLLKKALTEVMTKSSSIDLDELANSNMEIYWPYSEYWDGETMPVITYYRSDEELYGNITPGSVWAYKLSTGTKGAGYELDSILVDEEYAVNNPVWVINSPSTMALDCPILPTDDPVFEGDEPEQPLTPNNAHPWYLTNIQVTYQYDSWLDGGSEIQVQNLTPALPGYAGGANIISFYVTRKQIRRQEVVTINRLLNDDWRVDELTNTLIILEKDSGNTVTTSVSNSYIDKNGNAVNISTSFTHTAKDDLIHQMQYKRTTIQNTSPSTLWTSSDGNVFFRTKLH